LYPGCYTFIEKLEKEEIVKIAEQLSNKKNIEENLTFDLELKPIFEKICLPHRVVRQKIVLDKENSVVFRELFGSKELEYIRKTANNSKDSLEFIEKISGIKVKEKGGTFIGARMGRPEAAGERIMRGSPHVLFPIELYGGSTRSITKALNYEDSSRGKIEVEVVNFRCPKCKQMLVQPFCRKCNERAVKVYVCKRCKKEGNSEKCVYCGGEAVAFARRKINLTELINTELKFLGTALPDMKGVKGVINKDKIPEPIGKGIIRAKYNLHVFRDATIRYESINAPLTHFKPKEIGISVEKIKELGYKFDINGKEIENEEQIIELYPQDIIINEKAADFFVRVANFIDELLEKYYKMPKYYNINSKDDLIGHLVLGLAPHTSAAIVGRIIGFTKARACFAHPYFHQTKRRNVDGDQDSLMLMMDGLLNFSESYLPSSRGGRMDAPLVFTTVLDPSEIDEEVYEMERCWRYPLELYRELEEKKLLPSFTMLENVKKYLGTEKQYSGFGYTHSTKSFDNAPVVSRYVQLSTMEEKLERQALLQKRIRAVDTKDSLERTIISHLMPDIIGNARAFGRQTFRCTNCNTKFRRIPLLGRCTNCGRGNVILTIAQGSVRKYLEITKRIVEKYNLSSYLKQRVELIEREIFSVFLDESAGEEVKVAENRQKSLAEFA
ncbi:MAG: DNA polymerase II large subunit, partial [Candidatus Diapherotrites archaeon]|nr:DNA polymerase II large subunit [Candidatus Diapherotrites archaeon]